ncbi:hypothetical protein C1I99_01625 [Micromonospora deserti]|uniref:Uncharacterized protein n=1 Tax=Micromonospora deserti TaxID=2070366 RepID=A0A2W2DZP0_9ACTN|nr:hypothetical protein C1I99_01625 [Micromonospora deserti]
MEPDRHVPQGRRGPRCDLQRPGGGPRQRQQQRDRYRERRRLRPGLTKPAGSQVRPASRCHQPAIAVGGRAGTRMPGWRVGTGPVQPPGATLAGAARAEIGARTACS